MSFLESRSATSRGEFFQRNSLSDLTLLLVEIHSSQVHFAELVVGG